MSCVDRCQYIMSITCFLLLNVPAAINYVHSLFIVSHVSVRLRFGVNLQNDLNIVGLSLA